MSEQEGETGGVTIYADGDETAPSEVDLEEDVDLEVEIVGQTLDFDRDIQTTIRQLTAICDVVYEVLLEEFDQLDDDNIDVEATVGEESGYTVEVILPGGRLWKGTMIVGSGAGYEEFREIADRSINAVKPMLSKMIDKLLE